MNRLKSASSMKFGFTGFLSHCFRRICLLSVRVLSNQVGTVKVKVYTSTLKNYVLFPFTQKRSDVFFFGAYQTMSYRKQGVRIESCFKETALKDVETPIKLSPYR